MGIISNDMRGIERMSQLTESFFTKVIEVAPDIAIYLVTILILQWNNFRHNAQMERVHKNNVKTIRDNFETTYRHLLDMYEINKSNNQ